jgi:hypothetical protein
LVLLYLCILLTDVRLLTLRRRIDGFGAAIPFSGKNKEQLESLVREYDRMFIAERFRSLNRLDSELVQSALRPNVLEPPTQVVATILDNIAITRERIQEFNVERQISSDLFSTCLKLLVERENKINTAYFESNRQHKRS